MRRPSRSPLLSSAFFALTALSGLGLAASAHAAAGKPGDSLPAFDFILEQKILVEAPR